MLARRFRYASIALVALAATVIGCAVEPEPQETPRPPVTREATEAPESSTEPVERVAEVATVIPQDCETLLPIATVQTYDSRLTAHPGVDSEGQLMGILGPMTGAALQSGQQQIYCNWGITGSGALAYLGAAVINEATKSELVAALRDSVYEEIEPAGAEARFTQGQSYEHQITDDIIVDRDLLIAVSHTISGDFAQDAWAGIRQ
ncbi:hypothetical protein [Leucobacter aridicollis]